MSNLIARCANQVAREVCGARIYEDDEDAVEIDIGYICGPCVAKLLKTPEVWSVPSRRTRKSTYSGSISKSVTVKA